MTIISARRKSGGLSTLGPLSLSAIVGDGYSPMTNPHMTFIEAVAWIATRDGGFADTCPDRTHRGLAVSLAIRKSGGGIQHRSIDSAEKALLAKCRSGRITATGLRGDISGPTAKRRTRITDIEWIDIRGRATETRGLAV